MSDKQKKPPIMVWEYNDAPDEIKAIAPSAGGDEDWLALVPKEYAGQYIEWLDRLGVSSTYSKTFDDGMTIHVGTHA